jgi:alkylhydroperoxidase/carboxymuconolactone decarboxylase family protein YurZ
LTALRRLDIHFLETYLAYVAPGDRIEPKLRELILLAVNASCTLLNPEGVREHVRNALVLGATAAELVAVLELSSVVGIHTLDLGIPMLTHAAGSTTGSVAPSERQRRLKDELVNSNRETPWSPFWQALLDLDPDLFALTMGYLEAPWKSGALDPKVNEFIYIAIDSSSTHLYGKGLQVHIDRAKRWGATDGEIAEILRIVAGAGMTRTMALALPILADELNSLDDTSHEAGD